MAPTRLTSPAAGLATALAVLTLVQPPARAGSAPGQKIPPAAEAFFEAAVRPLLVKHCYQCHSSGAKRLRGGLALDTRAGWQAGGDSGPAVRPGDPDGSPLIQAVRYADELLQMPPRGKLAPDEIAALEKWVRMGAPDPRAGGEPPPKQGIDFAAARQFWAFRPVADPAPPAVEDRDWPRAAADHFLLAAMEARGVRPVADADPLTLARRLHYDLTGLPPTPEELDDFERDAAGDPGAAVERLVDRLLASPAFGEHWGRHWLDVARYADSNGSSFNPPFRHAWKYRNWVIDAVNRDMPFDQFILRQVAGDLLPADTQAERDANVIATCYLMLGSKVLGLFDKPTLQLDVVDEQLDTIGKGLLGLTVGCARCHDHKFDPIPQEDYYALAGIFTSTQTLDGRLDEPKADENDWNRRGLGPDGDAKLRAFYAEHRYDYVRAGRKLYQALTKLESLRGQAAAAALAAAEREAAHWRQQVADFEAMLPPLAMAVQDAAEPADTQVRIRGVAASPGATVPRGFLRVASFPGQPRVNPQQSGRLELARWIASADNPLTARVAVNRVWAHLFGAGIVRTVDNFGARGEPPSHPELLDHLASKFVAGGWRLKPFLRELVLSRAYRLASTHDPESYKIDPENRLFWRHNRRRLAAEEVRDSLLLAAGRLDRSPGTTRIDHLPLQDLGGDFAEAVARLPDDRRTVYQPVIRNLLADVLETFDFANPSMSVAQRPRTTVAPQALYLLNSPFVLDSAAATAALLVKEVPDRDPRRLAVAAFRRIACRPPTDGEAVLLTGYLRAQYEGAAAPSDRDVARLCHAVFASTRFQFLD